MLDQRELEALVDRLIDVLCAHLAVHRELAEVLEAKEKAVVGLQLDQLDQIVETERALINRIGDVETQRSELTLLIGTIIEAPDPASIRLSAVVPYVSQEIASTLIELRDELRDVADRIEKVQDRNRTLIGHSLDNIHLFLSILSGIDPSVKNYSPHGDVSVPSNPAVLDRRL